MLRLPNIKQTFRQGLVLWLLLIITISIIAQNTEVTLPVVGDVPLASKIQVTSDEDDDTQAIVQGEAGSVFPNAFVVVQNSYINEREIISASSNGDFVTSLYGRNETPYWVAAFQRFPSDDAINNAMGTTVYGEGDDNTFYVESDLGGNVPRYRIFGEVNTTELTEGENLVISLDVELDITDDFPDVDDLEIRFDAQLWVVDKQHMLDNRIGSGTANIDINRETNQIRFDLTLGYDSSIFEDVVPYISAYIRSGDGEWERWENSTFLGTQSSTLSEVTAILPILLSNPESTQDNLLWELDFVSHQSQPHQLAPNLYSLQPLWINPYHGIHIDDGQLTVTITHPDSSVAIIDTDIIQIESQLNEQTARLATDSHVLANYPFDDYGDYTISINGRLRIGDQSYFSNPANETVRLLIAESLYVQPSFLTGTPLEVGDTIPIGLHIKPRLPTDVTVTFVKDDQMISRTGQANERGYFFAEPIPIEDSGIYTLIYEANYTDDQNKLWSAQLTTTGAIGQADSTLTVHGQRGLAGYEGTQQAWFDTTVYPDDDHDAGRQPYFPYYSGDIAYIPDALDGGIAPFITSIENDILTLSVVSPNGRMRQFNSITNNRNFNGDDTFNLQVGMGIDDIRAGDYAFLFGGISNGENSAIYGALMVVEDEDAPARVLSPFLDTLTVFGQEVDMFFVPTGIRPAQVLELGEILAIVGQVAPTLPAEVTVSITSPSGKWTQFTDTANAIGYFYSHENDLPLDEIGIWQIDIDTTYHGETSAGQLEKPFPAGNLSYQIYVVPSDNSPLGEAEFITETTKTNTIYSLTIPDGWTDVRAFATVTTPSWMLSHEELTVFPAGTSYVFNPTQLARDYPNVELMETAEGNHVADVVTLTLAMTGIDASGEPAIRARTYTILHDVTYSTDGMYNQ